MDSFEKCGFGSVGSKHSYFRFGMSGGKLQGNRLLEQVSIIKLSPLSGSLIKSKSGGKGSLSSQSGLTVFLSCVERKSGEQLVA